MFYSLVYVVVYQHDYTNILMHNYSCVVCTDTFVKRSRICVLSQH